MAVVHEQKFYILRTVTGKEIKVKDKIEAEISTTDLGRFVSRVFVPMEKVVSQRNGKKIVKERPSLPGYIIVEAALVADTAFRLRNTEGVIGFLGGTRGSEPEPMSPAEVERLMKRADDIALGEGEYEIEYFVGDVVKVIDQAFAGCEAVVEEVTPERRKLKVKVKMFGRQMPLELDYAQVAKEL